MQSHHWNYLDYLTQNCQYATEISLFMRQNPQRNLSSRKLRRMLDMFEKLGTLVDNFRSEPFEQCVLHYIAERAFFSNLGDSEFVAKLMAFLYLVDNHLGFLLCPAALPGSVEFARFFLRHAYREKMTVNGRRVVDVEVFCRSIWLHPCEMAVVSESPALLHLLLQYGALITDKAMSLQRFRSRPAAGNILVITLCVLKTIAEVHRLQELQEAAAQDAGRRLQDMLRCARLLMRVSPQYGKGVLRQLHLDFPGFQDAEEAFRWIAANGVPELTRRVDCPMSLKHACRLAVRKRLHDGWQLPDGVAALPIPEPLKEFLNLDSD